MWAGTRILLAFYPILVYIYSKEKELIKAVLL